MAKKKKQKKIFILDTNVLLHDFTCIYNFEENDVIIPIVVLEELDKFKRGNDIINFHAREFTRELDKIAGDMLLTGNIPLGQNLGTLHIETGKQFSERVSESFPE
ncbi:MAG: PIN domain-containing protein, partial [Bacteroidota bacterium]|nr:PIN domain-containing protein [Bacteroidota bacterium]